MIISCSYGQTHIFYEIQGPAEFVRNCVEIGIHEVDIEDEEDQSGIKIKRISDEDKMIW